MTDETTPAPDLEAETTPPAGEAGEGTTATEAAPAAEEAAAE